MQLEIGEIYTGKVTGITKFGAFVSFENGQTGMVHISEVSTVFVNEIKDFITEGQEVKVMVLDITGEGKVSLSIKKTLPPEENPQHNRGGDRQARNNRDSRPRRNNFNRQDNSRNNRGPSKPAEPQQPSRPGNFEWQEQRNDTGSFEDMMSKFKQTSDEKISDLKRSTETKRGYSRRGS